MLPDFSLVSFCWSGSICIASLPAVQLDWKFVLWGFDFKISWQQITIFVPVAKDVCPLQ